MAETSWRAGRKIERVRRGEMPRYCGLQKSNSLLNWKEAVLWR